MKVRLKRDTIVRHKAGEILELPEAEGRRLIAFGLAAVEEEKPKRPRKKKEEA